MLTVPQRGATCMPDVLPKDATLRGQPPCRHETTQLAAKHRATDCNMWHEGHVLQRPSSTSSSSPNCCSNNNSVCCQRPREEPGAPNFPCPGYWKSKGLTGRNG